MSTVVWRCLRKVDRALSTESCSNRTVKESKLRDITLKAINSILDDSDTYIKTLQENIVKAVTNADTLSPDGIQQRLNELQKELISKANSRQDYNAVADEIFRLREQKEKAEAENQSRTEYLMRVKELQNFILDRPQEITEIDDSMVRKLISKITVFPDHFTVTFRSGVSVDINE